MAIDDETFFAWLDGELDGDQAGQVAAAVAGDPRLSALAEQHRALGTRLRGTFDAVSSAPLPERLAQAAKPASADAIPFIAGRSRRRAPWVGVPQWAAMAATLALGLGLGTTLETENGTSQVEFRDGKMIAAAQLDEALDERFASAATGDIRVGLTFRDQSGAICRTFTSQRSSGLACREGNDWPVRGMFAAPEGQSGDYRMAAGMDPNLAALIESTIQGEPFDADQEKMARAHGWR